MLEILVPPAAEPVSLAEAKAFLRIGNDADDTLLASLIAAARQAFEARTGRALVTRRVRQRQRMPLMPGQIRPWISPAQSLAAVWLSDAAGALTMAPAGLARLEAGRFLVGLAVPAASLVLDYDAGHGGPSAVPEALKTAVLEELAAIHARRDRDPPASPVDPLGREVRL